MKIGYPKEKIMGLFFKSRKKALSIGIIIFTLIITLTVYKIQAKKIELLQIKKDTEQKKNEVLNEISRSEKTIQFYKNLLTRKDASAVMGSISNLARESNLRLISISAGNEESQPLYTKTPFVLVIDTDSYSAIGKFISKIENQPEIYFVESVSIRLQEEIRGPDKELSVAPEPKDKLRVNLILSIIALKG